jgi:hypothetical protein
MLIGAAPQTIRVLSKDRYELIMKDLGVISLDFNRAIVYDSRNHFGTKLKSNSR